MFKKNEQSSIPIRDGDCCLDDLTSKVEHIIKEFYRSVVVQKVSKDPKLGNESQIANPDKMLSSSTLVRPKGVCHETMRYLKEKTARANTGRHIAKVNHYYLDFRYSDLRGKIEKIKRREDKAGSIESDPV